MPNHHEPELTPNTTIYQIRIEGHLSAHWSEWLGGVAITREANGTTRLTARVVDQAELFGLLRKVRDLGMPLLSVTRIEPGSQDDG